MLSALPPQKRSPEAVSVHLLGEYIFLWKSNEILLPEALNSRLRSTALL